MHSTTDHTTSEQRDPHCLAPGAAPALLAGTPWRRLLVMGDSIAAGDGDPVPGYADRSWAHRLADALRQVEATTAYLNLGVRGLRTAEIREQQMDAATQFAPDLAVVSAGANDMLRRSFHPAAIEPDLEAIVGSLSDAGCLVVTFGLLDLSRTSFVPDAMRSDLAGRLRTLNDLVRRVTERHDGIHVDYFDHPALDDQLFSADMVHPNRRGHACIFAWLVRALAGAFPGHPTASRVGEGPGKTPRGSLAS